MAERMQRFNCVSPLESLFILIILFFFFLQTSSQRARRRLPRGRAVGDGSPRELPGWMRCDSHLLRGFCCACGTGVRNTDANSLY